MAFREVISFECTIIIILFMEKLSKHIVHLCKKKTHFCHRSNGVGKSRRPNSIITLCKYPQISLLYLRSPKIQIKIQQNYISRSTLLNFALRTISNIQRMATKNEQGKNEVIAFSIFRSIFFVLSTVFCIHSIISHLDVSICRKCEDTCGQKYVEIHEI